MVTSRSVTLALAGLMSSSSILVVDTKPPPGVEVTPDGSFSPERRPYTNGYSATFTVKNTSTATATFTLTRESSSNITTTGQDYTAVTLAPNASMNRSWSVPTWCR